MSASQRWQQTSRGGKRLKRGILNVGNLPMGKTQNKKLCSCRTVVSLNITITPITSRDARCLPIASVRRSVVVVVASGPVRNLVRWSSGRRRSFVKYTHTLLPYNRSSTDSRRQTGLQVPPFHAVEPANMTGRVRLSEGRLVRSQGYFLTTEIYPLMGRGPKVAHQSGCRCRSCGRHRCGYSNR